MRAVSWGQGGGSRVGVHMAGLRSVQNLTARAALLCPMPHLSQRCGGRAAGYPGEVGRKPKHEDGTLEGRYATALFMASGDKLEKVPLPMQPGRRRWQRRR